MGNTQIASNSKQASVWLEGFSLNDFMAPSAKTEIAEVTSAVANVVFEMDANITAGESFSFEDAEEQSFGMEVIQEWGTTSNNLSDWTDRKVAWPLIDPDDYSPNASAEVRIADNLTAVRLLRDLQSSKREVNDEDRATLLKYCGWGGLARLFTPDGSKRHTLADQRDELESLSSEEEFIAMRSSITSAYFTDPAVVTALWQIVQHLGFQGGRILEPTAGVGHFLAGMPADLAKKSDVTAVELDTISAGMLEASFGPLGVQVHASALEKARLPVAFYDLVIGNVPFGDHKSLDTTSADYANWSIHNWAIGKSVDLVRPGGLIVLITSRHSLDSKTDSHRKWLSAHAELVASYRLPTMAFKSQANTEAVTDIVVLKRRESPDYRASGWVELGKATPEMIKQGQELTTISQPYGNRIDRDRSINSYYVRNPENVLGRLVFESTQYGESMNPVFTGTPADLQELLQNRIESLPANVYTAKVEDSTSTSRSSMQRYEMESYVAPGSMVVKNGRICVSEGDELLDIDTLYTGTSRKRVLGMIEVKKHAVAVIEFQAKSQDDVELQRLQTVLNGTYDAFVASMGYLSTSANSRLMRSDPSWPLMLALEMWDDEDEKAVKADIFFKRTVGHRTVPDKVDNVKDAMLISLAEFGKIVLKDLATRTGMPVMQVVKELGAQAIAFRDPELGRWVPTDEYLSGHIRDKISAAQAAGPAYAENVPALEAVLPKDLGPSEVEARLGAPWIPVDVIEQFANELVAAKDNAITVEFEAQSATWSVKYSGWKIEFVGDHVLQTSKWGTAKRCALTLVEAALNQQPPSITVEIDGKRVVDRMATLAAREKWQAIRDHFRKWIYQDSARRDRLLRIYNDAFNQIVNRKFDGSHLMLPGMSSAVLPYGHQKDGIWRVVVNGNTLLAHCVGAGKTLVMCAASMELRRLGKAVKPAHVVPNHCLEQYSAEFVRLYPQARVLMASKDDLHGDNRRTFAARVATGDFDAVVMTQSTFERLMLSPDVQQEFIRKMLAEARVAESMTKDSGAKRSLKEIEKRMKDMEARLERLVAAGKKDSENVWFDELGIDQVFLDEAHAYKNMGRISKMPRIAGLPNVSSQRAFDVFMKTRVIMDMHGGREEGVVMATATPISNSLAELHTFQVYLQPKTLKKFGLYEFDAWSASYGESVTGIELAPDGGGYRMNTRYCRFVNLPELMGIFRGVADIRTKRMLNLPTPEIEGGKAQTMVAKPSEELLGIVAGLVDRAEKIRSGAVKPEDDNMLKVTNVGRNAALDIRLVDPFLPFDKNGKLAIAAENMVSIWKKSHAIKGTQLVFSDLGTPNNKSFNVYDEVKRLLIDKGVPGEQIEFIHDHDSDKAKAKLFKRVRDGSVRFLLGSTAKMGTGTNVQKRLKAIHQLDAPWVPSAVEQRDGRADRQGNLNETIELWRYVTERSFDAYSWNLLNVKANFIEQVMTAESGLRTVEDISMSALSYAEIKAIASGNPLVMEKATVDADVQKVSLLRSQWEDERWSLGRRESRLVSRLAYIDKNMANMEAEAKLAEKALASNRVFVPATSIGSKAVDSLGNGAQGLAGAFRAHSHRGSTGGEAVGLGSFGGFSVEYSKVHNDPNLYLVGPISGAAMRVDRPHINDLAGVGLAIDRTLQRIAETPGMLRNEYGEKSNELATTRSLMVQEFDQAEKLEALLQRQREIESELDLDKDAEGSQNMATESV
ncbi:MULTISPECIES: helicase-related protein [Polaromonas]|uniref:Helicase-related protein n=1 Tax=Polaromonas aquatica TaxID=332657 RepID=A0ABW1TZE6_9BURK